MPVNQQRSIIIRQPTGGLVDTPFLDKLRDDQARVCKNVRFTRLGIEKRRGRSTVGQQIAGSAPCQFLYQYRPEGGTEQLLGVFGQHLFYLDRTDTVTSGNAWGTWKGVVSDATTPTADDIIGNSSNELIGDGIQHGGRFYYVDGGSGGSTLRKCYDGSVPEIRDWGFQNGDLPAMTTQTITGGGNLSAGEYHFRYVLERSSDGAKTNASPSVSTTVSANDRVALYVDAIDVLEDPDDWDILHVYRSAVGGGEDDTKFDYTLKGLRYLDTMDHYLGVSDRIDGTLGANPDLTGNSPIPLLRYLGYAPGTDRILAAGDPTLKTRMYWSKNNNANSWPATNSIDLSQNSGDDITGLNADTNRIYILTKRGVWLAARDTQGLYQREQVIREYGGASHWGVVLRNGVLWWVSRKGVVAFPGNQPVNISEPAIRQTFAPLIADAAFDTCHGVSHERPENPHLRWVLGDPNASGQRSHYVYDTTLNAWMIDEPNDLADDATGRLDRVLLEYQAGDHGGAGVFVGDTQGNVFFLDKDTTGDVYSDSGLGYTMDWRSRWFGNGYNDLVVDDIIFGLRRSSSGNTAGNLKVSLWRDADETEVQTKAFPLTDSGPELRRVRFRANARVGQYFSFGFAHEAAGGDVGIAYIVIVYRYEGETEPREI